MLGQKFLRYQQNGYPYVGLEYGTEQRGFSQLNFSELASINSCTKKELYIIDPAACELASLFSSN